MTHTLELYDKVAEATIIKMLQERVNTLETSKKMKILNKEIENRKNQM